MVHRIETLLRSPIARLLTLIAVLTSFSCAVDSFDQFNKGNPTPFYCETNSDCLEPDYRCNETLKRCEENITIECFDDDGDKVFTGDGCLAAIEDRDCDDSNPLRNPVAPEKCDGVDNDCDDKVDDGIEPKSCPKFEGVCGTLVEIPVYACVAGSQNSAQCETGCKESEFTADGTCAYGAEYVRNEDGTVNPSLCDGKDNDCDGQTDEIGCDCQAGSACGSFACGNGVPADKCPCDIPGTIQCPSKACLDSGGNPVPEPFASDEVAGDGIDNNCDGQIDE